MERSEQPKLEKPITGTGGEFLEKRKELRLPAIEVKNKVISLNPAFEGTLPFKIEQGKPLPFAYFFTPTPSQSPEEKIHHVSVMPERGYKEVPGRGRSGLIGSVVFEDQQGRRYRDLGIKGIGVFNLSFDTGSAEVARVIEQGPHEALGLVNYPHAIRDWDYAEDFLRSGIRTYRIVAIASLEEIVDENGQKISVFEAKRLKIIPEGMNPVIEVRAFGTTERIDYLASGGQDRERMALDDAKALVAQELGKDPQKFSWEEYTEWFVKTLGQQVAKIRNLGLHNGYLTSHNITLDCRIVDLDSVASVRDKIEDYRRFGVIHSKEWFYKGDLSMARGSLQDLISSLQRLGLLQSLNSSSFIELFNSEYQEELVRRE
ncbi:MAG: hypothetical protein HYW89_01965 [Candidatus Sungiibacteriota bacterium]|uniref:Uncharacterized protein n=1 Tax=Candidatus Sungiibacteriota bacterium TaxID=2750080 RepID=A0A7T5UQB8_9BACT|nr:MAG: hypothetical protein HYW89_01965 [Candidatus Sungbacteria bacterium]